MGSDELPSWSGCGYRFCTRGISLGREETISTLDVSKEEGTEIGSEIPWCRRSFSSGLILLCIDVLGRSDEGGGGGGLRFTRVLRKSEGEDGTDRLRMDSNFVMRSRTEDDALAYTTLDDGDVDSCDGTLHLDASGVCVT